MTKKRNLTLSYCILQGIFWIVTVAEMSYATPLLEVRGMNELQIGMIHSAKFIALIVTQLALEAFIVRNRSKYSLKQIVSVLVLIAICVTIFFLIFPHLFAVNFLVFLIYGATINCTLPLIESMSIEYIKAGKKLHYTLSRAVGSLTYSVMCILLGLWTKQYGMEFVVFFLLVTLSLYELSILSMEEICSRKRQRTVRRQRIPLRAMLKRYKKYRLFLLECGLIFGAYDLNIMFLIDRVKEIGGTSLSYGFVFAFIGLAEIPVALLFSKINAVFKLDTLMMIFALFCTFRAIGTTFAVNCMQLILVQSVELFGMGVFYAGSLYFVMQYLPAECSVLGMSLINIVAVGIGEALASLCAGLLKAYLGLQSLMILSCIISCLGAAVGIRMKCSNQQNP